MLFEPEFSGDDSEQNDQPNAWERELNDDETVSSESDQFSLDGDQSHGYKLEELKVQPIEPDVHTPPKHSPRSDTSDRTPDNLRRVLREMQKTVN